MRIKFCLHDNKEFEKNQVICLCCSILSLFFAQFEILALKPFLKFYLSAENISILQRFYLGFDIANLFKCLILMESTIRNIMW